MKKLFTPLFLGLLAITACTNKVEEKSVHADIPGSRTKPKYAKFFDVEVNGKTKIIHIYNPWKSGQEIQQIVVGENGVKAPVTSIVPLSTSFFGYIDKLGKLNSISAVEDVNYVYNPILLEKVKSGEVPQVGQSGTVSVERTIELNPQMIIVSGSEILGPNMQKIAESGIPVLNNMDWQEQHPLGRAEWIKVFGILYGEEKLADSLFNQIESKYIQLCERVQAELPKERQDVLLGYNYQGTWFLPGGKSYVGKYLKDSGINYKFSNDTATGSLPVNAELVYHEFANSDFWLNPGSCKNLKELLLLDARYKNLKAFQTKNVYNNTNRSNSAGGNDFWENSPSSPDIVLSDLVKIFYPQLLPEHKLYFYQRLE